MRSRIAGIPIWSWSTGVYLIQEGISHGLSVVLHEAVHLVQILCSLPQGSPGPGLQHFLMLSEQGSTISKSSSLYHGINHSISLLSCPKRCKAPVSMSPHAVELISYTDADLLRLLGSLKDAVDLLLRACCNREVKVRYLGDRQHRNLRCGRLSAIWHAWAQNFVSFCALSTIGAFDKPLRRPAWRLTQNARLLCFAWQWVRGMVTYKSELCTHYCMKAVCLL